MDSSRLLRVSRHPLGDCLFALGSGRHRGAPRPRHIDSRFGGRDSLLIWRTSVAARQLNTSNEIAATANRSRADSIFAEGSKMLGDEAPETRWAGINTLIALVDEHPEYTERVVTSFCAFRRPRGRIHDTLATPGKSQDQKKRVLEAMGLWLAGADWDGNSADLEGVTATGVALSGTRLSNAKLVSASLSVLTANKVDFSKADFSRTRTRFSCRLSFFTDCTFDGAILTDTDFTGVDFTGSTFVDADITKLHYSVGAGWRPSCFNTTSVLKASGRQAVGRGLGPGFRVVRNPICRRSRLGPRGDRYPPFDRRTYPLALVAN